MDFLIKVKDVWQRMNKKVVIIAAGVFVVLCAACIALGIYFNSPSVVFLNTTKRFVNDVLTRKEFVVFADVVEDGSIDISASKLKLNDEELVKNTSVGTKVYFSELGVMLDDLKVKSNTINVSGEIFISDDHLYINESKILGGAYGVRFDQISRHLEKSIFAYGSGSKYEITNKEIYDSIVKATKENPYDEEMMKDFAKVLKVYTKDIYKIVCENAEFETENEAVRVGGEKINARIITVSYNEDNVSEMVYSICEYLTKDTLMIEFLEEHGDKLRGYLNMYPGAEFDEDDSVVEIYEDFLEELEENIEDTCDDIKKQDIDLEIVLATPKNSSKLLSLEVSDGKDEVFSLDVGAKGVKKSNGITVEVGETKIVYEIEQDDKAAYESSIKVNGEKITSFEIDRDKGKFEIFFGSGDTGYTVKGNITTEKGVTTMSVSKVTHTYKEGSYDDKFNYIYTDVDDVYETNLKIVISNKDAMPTPLDDFKTIDKIKEKDIDEWIENIQYMVNPNN